MRLRCQLSPGDAATSWRNHFGRLARESERLTLSVTQNRNTQNGVVWFSLIPHRDAVNEDESISPGAALWATGGPSALVHPSLTLAVNLIVSRFCQSTEKLRRQGRRKQDSQALN